MKYWQVTLSRLIALITMLISLPITAQDGDRRSEQEVDLAHVQQEAMELKQAVLTYGEDQREQLVDETEAALRDFDHRIALIEASIRDRSEDMSAAAERYAQEMMSTLSQQRNDLDRWFNTLQTDSDDAWDQVVYGFSRAYDDFYNSWQDLEAQFGVQ